MRSDWLLPICKGKERLRFKGEKSHATQKPESLLYRIIMACTKPGDVVLDPFFGTGTRGVVARRLNRSWIGIERHPVYVDLARKRIGAVEENVWPDSIDNYHSPRKEPRLPIGDLLSHGLLKSGQRLFFLRKSEASAILLSDGSLQFGEQRGSIHQIAQLIQTGPANGWDLWHYLDEETGSYQPLDYLRQKLRLSIKSISESEI